MNNDASQQWLNFLLILSGAALLGAWLLIPPAIAEKTWHEEHRQLIDWAGESAHQWVVGQASGMLDAVSADATTLMNQLDLDNDLEKWISERTYVTLLLMSILIVRLFSLVMWILLSAPLLLAATVDGYHVREIRKTSFVFQSPLRHMAGTRLILLSCMAAIVWLCIPLPVPTVITPIIVLLIALALWLWSAHLQKRI